ncbi:glycosyltransferase [Rhodococcoides corynebacterioides]|uniref:glycosyltransferase n=1 Tax=Rhodococcoides corynebacterioides TaxID=53972 RepID=UPI000829904B|nr:glycosyltransferase [Rhodococcus corynebacterioides]
MIGYYVHHHGVGHLARASSIVPFLQDDVTIFSSRPAPDRMSASQWVAVPMDTAWATHRDTGPDARGTTAGGALHWAPTGVPGLTERMATIAAWIERHRPRAFVVDVSVEVSTFVRLMGIPLVVLAMPGERTDAPHRLAYTLADRIVAPWSRTVYDPEWLREHADKTVYAGSISRVADRVSTGPRVPDTAVLMSGAGGSSLAAGYLDAVRAATPDTTWRGVGTPGEPWVDDVWPILDTAGVVVTHGGQNAVADVAAANAPAVVVAEDRPFDEQRATARALDRAGLAVALDAWPDPAAWPDLLRRARALSADLRTVTEIDGAAARAAAAIESVAG